MAIIGKIRNYSWLLLAFIGLALLAFILGDFVRKGQSHGPKNDLAVIAGETVTFNDFNNDFEAQSELIKEQNRLNNLDKNQADKLKSDLWIKLVQKIIVHKEAKELGLIVKGKESNDQLISPEELSDIFAGKEPNQYVVNFLTQGHPEKFDAKLVSDFTNNLDKQEPVVRNIWLNLEKELKEERLTSKYFTLISKGLYVTSSEAKKTLEASTKTAKYRFTALKYNTISDSTLKVSDDEVKKYYEKHKFEYEQEDGRTVEYVAFEVKPSKEDLKKSEEDIMKMKEEFAKDKDPEAYVNSVNTADNRFSQSFVKKGTLDKEIDSLFFTATEGTIYGPYMVDETYKVAKLIARQARPDSLKARHILIGFSGSKRDTKATLSKEKAKAKADSIMAAVKKDTAKFSELALKFSNDPSVKENKGSMGWFNEGAMVKSFNDACVNGKKGDVVVIESEFGFHIINVLDKTTPINKVQVAIVVLPVNISQTTYNTIENQANTFAAEANTAAIFEKKIVEKGLNKRICQDVKEADPERKNSVPGLEDPTMLVRWAYGAEKDAVSETFNVGRKYVVAHLKEIRKKGFAPLEQIKTDMELGAKRVKKGEMLTAKINDQLKNAKTINELAEKLKTKLDTVEAQSFMSINMPMLGPEPSVVGTVFGLKAGQMSKPIIGKSGVVVVTVDEFKENTSPVDVKMAQNQLTSMLRQRASSINSDAYKSALFKKANIIDNRGKFY